MKKLISFSTVVILAALPGYIFCQNSYTSTIDYIQKTNKLWGVSACIINGDKSVALVDSKDKGYGFGLWMADGKGSILEKATLKSGQSCELADGHHTFINYKFIGVKDGRIIVEVTDKFDARSFGHGVKKQKKRLTIFPYNDNQQ